MDRKPIIGVTPLYDDERESIWMLPGYCDALRACGALPFILPFVSTDPDIEQLVEACDGFLFTGGHDVDPALYEQKRSPRCGATSAQRDRLEFSLFQRALLVDAPVLGICRGAQFINAVLGGTLYQDLPTQLEGAVSHQMKSPYHRPWHGVDLVPGTPLYYLVKSTKLQVNSYHHQGIRELSFQLAPMAYAPDGLVEAFWHPSKTFTWGVQWHPEYAWMTDRAQRQIFEAFVAACSQKAQTHPNERTHRKGSPFLATL